MSDETKCPDCGEAWGHKYECVVMRIRREGVTPPTPDPREREETSPERDALYVAIARYGDAREKHPGDYAVRDEAAGVVGAAIEEFAAALRAPAPSEAVAEVATDGGYLRWRLNGTDPLDSIELRLPSGTWISVHGNNGVAVTVERVQAWARLLTHPAPARGVTVRFGAFNGSMTLDDSALSEATMEYGWGSSATAKELQAWREHAGRIIVAYLSALDGDAMVERGARAYNDAVFSPLLADELPLSSGEVVRRILTAAITPDAEGGA